VTKPAFNARRTARRTSRVSNVVQHRVAVNVE
jgi:hypothetical protein